MDISFNFSKILLYLPKRKGKGYLSDCRKTRGLKKSGKVTRNVVFFDF